MRQRLYYILRNLLKRKVPRVTTVNPSVKGMKVGVSGGARLSGPELVSFPLLKLDNLSPSRVTINDHFHAFVSRGSEKVVSSWNMDSMKYVILKYDGSVTRGKCVPSTAK